MSASSPRTRPTSRPSGRATTPSATTAETSSSINAKYPSPHPGRDHRSRRETQGGGHPRLWRQLPQPHIPGGQERQRCQQRGGGASPLERVLPGRGGQQRGGEGADAVRPQGLQVPLPRAGQAHRGRRYSCLDPVEEDIRREEISSAQAYPLVFEYLEFNGFTKTLAMRSCAPS
jgi:hypothetical protein